MSTALRTEIQAYSAGPAMCSDESFRHLLDHFFDQACSTNLPHDRALLHTLDLRGLKCCLVRVLGKLKQEHLGAALVGREATSGMRSMHAQSLLQAVGAEPYFYV